MTRALAWGGRPETADAADGNIRQAGGPTPGAATSATFRAVGNASFKAKAVLIRSSRLGRLWRRLTFRIRS